MSCYGAGCRRNGIGRTRFQVLTDSGAKVTCVEVNEWGMAEHEWFMKSIEEWQLPEELKVYAEKGTWDNAVSKDWDFVLVIPLESVRKYWSGNDGMQAWRHRRTGYVVPDHCRQTGGCPEVWNSSDVKGRRELEIANLEEIEEFVVLDHRQVSRSAFPELSHRRKKVISFPR